jgi:hypothetical protein
MSVMDQCQHLPFHYSFSHHSLSFPAPIPRLVHNSVSLLDSYIPSLWCSITQYMHIFFSYYLRSYLTCSVLSYPYIKCIHEHFYNTFILLCSTNCVLLSFCRHHWTVASCLLRTVYFTPHYMSWV